MVVDSGASVVVVSSTVVVAGSVGEVLVVEGCAVVDASVVVVGASAVVKTSEGNSIKVYYTKYIFG